MGRDLDRDSRINPRYGAGGKKICLSCDARLYQFALPLIYVGPRRVSRAEVR